MGFVSNLSLCQKLEFASILTVFLSFWLGFFSKLFFVVSAEGVSAVKGSKSRSSTRVYGKLEEI